MSKRLARSGKTKEELKVKESRKAVAISRKVFTSNLENKNYDLDLVTVVQLLSHSLQCQHPILEC